MRKPSIYVLTAAISLAAAGAVPVAAHGAVNTYTNTYTIPGGKGQVIMIGGSMNGLQDILGQMNGGMNWGNCDVNIPVYPDFNVPGSNMPDNSLPTPEFPIPDQPGNMLPDDMENGTGQNDFADQVAKLVNEERAKAGLSPLTVKRDVAAAAQTRAREIQTNFSHTRPDGSSFSTALTEAGVSYRLSGENIAYGQRDANQVMRDWMNSSGHRANILNPGFTSIGVGHYKNAAGVDYWTQLFTQ